MVYLCHSHFNQAAFTALSGLSSLQVLVQSIQIYPHYDTLHFIQHTVQITTMIVLHLIDLFSIRVLRNWTDESRNSVSARAQRSFGHKNHFPCNSIYIGARYISKLVYCEVFSAIVNIFRNISHCIVKKYMRS